MGQLLEIPSDIDFPSPVSLRETPSPQRGEEGAALFTSSDFSTGKTADGLTPSSPLRGEAVRRTGEGESAGEKRIVPQAADIRLSKTAAIVSQTAADSHLTSSFQNRRTEYPFLFSQRVRASS
jgi:hypothetical protein